jgi:glycosyltransferase involved in cell wall biosynthesis
MTQERSVSAIIACYKDAQAIPIMAARLTSTFEKIGVDYELIFVNDGSPDDTQEVLERLTASDRHIKAITHSRNFGSQRAGPACCSTATSRTRRS